MKPSDSKAHFEQMSKKFQKQEKDLDIQNKFIQETAEKQINQCINNVKGVFEEQSNVFNECKKFIKGSEQSVSEINKICDKMKKNKMPKQNSVKLSQELEKTKSDYMELCILMSNITKDKKLLEEYKVRINIG